MKEVNNPKMLTRKRIYEIIEKGEEHDKQSILFDKAIVFLIIINIMAIILESFSSLRTSYKELFFILEVVSVIIFSIEYILRVITADYKHEGVGNIKSRIKLILSPMALIDLFAILPFYLPMLIPIDLRFLRVLRLLRMFRIFKLNRYSKSMALVFGVIEDEKENLLVTVFITGILILLSSTIMYHVENDVQPDQFPNILSAFWWSIATLTTVGYGDVYPVTTIGKILSGIIALLGIGIVALPTGILSTGFMKKLEKDEKVKTGEKGKYCPHCGKEIH